jgi:DNA modification methylase
MIDNWDDIPTTKILHGDCMQLLKTLPSNSIDAICTDPPYGMSADGIARTWADIEEGRKLSGFMGKDWDAAVPCHNFFAECLRVLKHGGHMIAFSSTRTVCALGMAAQQGGFVIRDMIHWCYFSGFPKSHDISKAIDREAGAVREVVGTNPNVKSGSTGWQDTGYVGGKVTGGNADITKPATQDAQKWAGFGTALKPAVEPALLLRKPLEKGLTIAQNVLKHGTGALNIDACRFGYGDPCWVGSQDKDTHRQNKSPSHFGQGQGVEFESGGHSQGRWPANLYQCAKASRSEREKGLDHLETTKGFEAVHRKEGSAGLNNPRAGAGRTADQVRNIHPTVKPIKLMRWCCRLIGGQKGSVILDPFTGSGTTGAAALLEGFDFVGMELTPEYLPIIEGRIDAARKQYKLDNAQLSLFEDQS